MFDSRKIRKRVVCHDNAIKTADKNILYIIFLHIIIYGLQIDENQTYFCSIIGTELRPELLFSYFIFVLYTQKHYGHHFHFLQRKK